MALRAGSDRPPARSARKSMLLRDPPWFSVFSVVKPCLLAWPRSREGLDGSHRQPHFVRTRTRPLGRERLI
jgi:hypothetical protein